MSDTTKETIAAAFRAQMVAEATAHVDHLPPEQEDECFRQRVHIVLTAPNVFQVMADVDRFVELAMEVVYERAWTLGYGFGYTDATKDATKKLQGD